MPHVKLCKTQKICWNVQQKRIENSKYLLEGSTIPNRSEPYFTNLSGMRENFGFVWLARMFSESHVERNENISVIWIEQPVLLMKRYFASNTMHLFHDEFLPGLATILHHPKLRESIDDRLIISIDEMGSTPNDEMLTWLGQFWRINNLQASLRYRNGLKPTQLLDYICFDEAYVGLDSPSTSWYHYGFEIPQGPIEKIDRELVGRNVRSAVDWIKDQILGTENYLKLVESSDVFNNTAINKKPKFITIVSRIVTRLILNEEELKEKLGEAFPFLEVKFIRHETMSMEFLIETISNSIVMIGMHGALLALSAFLPENSLLIELFPFGIPTKNYTPYRTLTALPGMKIKYREWVNLREEFPFNVEHPERHLTAGGLQTFPKSYQNGIRATKTVPSHRCCYSPFWLFRIFQDTKVDSESVIKLIKEAFSEDKNN